MARKFDVIVRVEGNFTKDYQFTATFVNKSLVDILELLKLSTSLNYTISTQKKRHDDTFSQKQ